MKTLIRRIPKWSIGGILVALVALTVIVRFAKWPDPDPCELAKSIFLERSVSLFRQVTRSNEDVTATVGVIPGRWHEGTYMPGLARVQMCSSSQDAVVVDWETDTGELNRMSSKIQDCPKSGVAAIDKLEAAKISLYWLRKLGVASTAPMWKLDSHPKLQFGGLYVAQWSTPDRTVVITIHAQTGELSNIKVRHVVTPQHDRALWSRSPRLE